MTTTKVGTPAAGFPPRSLIVTIYGLYAREQVGWFSVSTLISMMAELDVDEAAVRSSISRLKRRGILVARAHGGVAGYAVSDSARGLLAEGDRRIFKRPAADVRQGWLLAVFSVPESERSRRHTLRSRLIGLGFGTVSAGVWIAPAHLAAETQDVLRRHDLTAYVDLFRADYLAFGDVGSLVGKWWDLDTLNQLYDDFLTVYVPVLSRWQSGRPPTDGQALQDGQAFRDYVQALTAWRRLPYLDPGLPGDVLPAGWKGARATDLFSALGELLAEPARQFVDQLPA